MGSSHLGPERVDCGRWLAALALLAPGMQGDPGRYVVRWVREDPPRLRVEADLPIQGRDLSMDTTRPGLIPALDGGGWPALVHDVRAVDERGALLALEGAGDAGWRLTRDHAGRIELAYEVDFAPLAALGWPAAREACWLEQGFFSVVGRSLFVVTPALEASRVAFELPEGWQAAAPWDEDRAGAGTFVVRDAQHLAQNLVVLARTPPEQVQAGGLRVLVACTSAWEPARGEIRRVIAGAIPRLVDFMGTNEPSSYLVALLPQPETGGESFRSSFASTFAEAPARENSDVWGNTIAHEVFHRWNGWGLHGADDVGTQWFHEGFTEYAANVALVAGGIATPEQFLAKLAEHVRRSRELATSLEATGGRKGPPLYSAGALVAFDWDVRIRHATGGRKDLWYVLRALWDRTGGGAWPYAWEDLEAELSQACAFDWNGFRRDHIAGREPLPLAETFTCVGIALRERQGEAPELAPDPAAPEPARALWRSLTRGASGAGD